MREDVRVLNSKPRDDANKTVLPNEVMYERKQKREREREREKEFKSTILF